MGRTRQTADLVGGSAQLSVNATNDTLHIGTGVTIFGSSGIVSATSLFISGDSVFGGAAPVGIASGGSIVSTGATLIDFGTNLVATVSGSGNIATITATGGGGGSSTLDGLSDVTISNLQTNEILKYNGSAWVNDTDATGGGGGGGSVTMAIGVRVGTAVTFAFSGSSFNVLNRSGGNTVINI